MSFKVEVKVAREDRFISNGVALATAEEAEKYGRHKKSSWTMVEKYQVVESSEEPGYRWDDENGLVPLERVEVRAWI